MKIEVNKFYRTRGGWRAKVVADDMGGTYRFLVLHYMNPSSPHTVRTTPGGTCDYGPNDCNLIAEWVDPPKPQDWWMVSQIFKDKETAELYLKVSGYGFHMTHLREVTDE